MDYIAQTPQPPYYAVIFTSRRTKRDNGYTEMAEEMMELARQQPGFLGAESVRDATGVGITVSYWESEDAIRLWREHSRHQIAQKLGREEWYERFAVRVCKVERAYTYERGTHD
jgi:heme-degrading monooxygenase HmoA